MTKYFENILGTENVMKNIKNIIGKGKFIHVGYTNGKRQILYALTYENNDKNRSKFLIKKIINEFTSSHGITTKFGYDQEAFVTEAEFEYKEFEVGKEWFA